MLTKRQTEHGVSRRLFNNTVINFVGQGLILVLNFATAPYIVHHLGAELFGVVALVQTTAGFANFLNLGIGRSLTKYISELYWKADITAINRLFQTAWAISIVTGLAGLVVMVGPRHFIAKTFFRGGPDLGSVTDFAIYIAGLGILSSVLLDAVSSLPSALQRFGVMNGIYVAVTAIRSLGMVVALAVGYSIKTVLLINLLSNLAGVAAYAVAGCFLIPGLSLVPKFQWVEFRNLFSFSFPLLLSSLSTLIVTRVDRFILAYFLPLSAVTFYTLPYSLSEKLSMGVSNITSVVFPFTSELHAKDAHEKVQELYIRSTKLLMIITLPLMVILVAAPGPILTFWLGPEYAAQGSTALGLLGAAMFLNAVSAVPTVTALGVGRPWVPTFFALVGAGINLAVNFTLIPKYGINGAALGALIPQALVVPIFLYVVSRKLRISVLRVGAQAFTRPLACAAVQLVLIMSLHSWMNRMLNLLAVLLLSVCLFGVLSLFGAITRDERIALFRMPAPNLN